MIQGIRAATIEDRERIVEMASRFIEQTPYGQILGAPNRGLLAFIVEKTVQELGVILLGEVDGQVVGMLAIAALAHPFTGELYGDELCWWVEPEQRRSTVGYKLLCAGEDWARLKGCVVLKMVSPVGSDVGTHYERLGYSQVETVYQKKL